MASEPLSLNAPFNLAVWAKQALAVQDACNLSGVVASFARMTHEMRASGMDTDACNRHPFSVLFSSKIASLTRSEDGFAFGNAYNQAKIMAGEW
jgi:hypothetical protein